MRAASIRFLERRQPRFTHVPPCVRDSVITAVLPSSAALSAAANAVEPDPRMTRSKRSSAIRHLRRPVLTLATWEPFLGALLENQVNQSIHISRYIALGR